MNDTMPYDRLSVNSIYDYLKDKATELSEGRWTDFSSGDIGSVLLGLMAYLADANNFHIDKTASELFIDTAVERSSILELIKLVGYVPRHYESAYTNISIVNLLDDKTAYVIPAYTTFTNEANTITYTSLEDIQVVNGVGFGVVYEGIRKVVNFDYKDITSDGKLFLPDYKIGTNTVELRISGILNSKINKVEDVRFIAGEFAFSVHVNADAQVYIQLPSYWSDLISTTASIQVTYLLTSGEAGRVGANVLTQIGKSSILTNSYAVTNPEASTGGYFPETADDLKLSAPKAARTMKTIVTKNDMEDLLSVLPEIASIKCGDYNDSWTGYIQPTEGEHGYINDAFKAKVLAVPYNVNETSLYEDKYSYVLKASLTQTDTYTGTDGTVITYTSPTADLPSLYLVDDNYKQTKDIRYVYEYEKVAEHQFTSTAKEMVDYINDRRLAGLYIEYEDPKRVVPNIDLDIYINENDLRKSTIADSVKTFMKAAYSRKTLTIGKSLYGSVIGRDILSSFPEIEYIEVHSPENNIKVDPDEYIDMYYAKFKIKVNDQVVIDEWD